MMRETIFKKGWDIPSVDLAYFVGVVASDGSIGFYEFSMSSRDEEYILRAAKIIYSVFGVMPKGRNASRMVRGKRLYRLWACAKMFLNEFGTEEDIQRNRVKSSGDFIDFIDNKFIWVWQDPYFWYFVAGLYDGDGCLARQRMKNCKIWLQVSLAIRSVRSKDKMIVEFRKRGLEFRKSGKYSLALRGGNEARERFLGKLEGKAVLRRKLGV